MDTPEQYSNQNELGAGNAVYVRINFPISPNPPPADIYLGAGGRIGTAILARLLATVFEKKGYCVLSIGHVFELHRALITLRTNSEKFPLHAILAELAALSLDAFATIATYDGREGFYRVLYPPSGAFTLPEKEMDEERALLKRLQSEPVASE